MRITRREDDQPCHHTPQLPFATLTQVTSSQQEDFESLWGLPLSEFDSKRSCGGSLCRAPDGQSRSSATSAGAVGPSSSIFRAAGAAAFAGWECPPPEPDSLRVFKTRMRKC